MEWLGILILLVILVVIFGDNGVKDEEGRTWIEKRDGVFMNHTTCYKPPPDYEDDPPLPMGASQKAIDAWDKNH